MKILPPLALFACATFLCAASAALAGSADLESKPYEWRLEHSGELDAKHGAKLNDRHRDL